MALMAVAAVTLAIAIAEGSFRKPHPAAGA
jgi:hypothetical protein